MPFPYINIACGRIYERGGPGGGMTYDQQGSPRFKVVVLQQVGKCNTCLTCQTIYTYIYIYYKYKAVIATRAVQTHYIPTVLETRIKVWPLADRHGGATRPSIAELANCNSLNIVLLLSRISRPGSFGMKLNPTSPRARVWGRGGGWFRFAAQRRAGAVRCSSSPARTLSSRQPPNGSRFA